MALIGTYYTIEPKDWLFSTHGDVVEAKRRADIWFKTHNTYDGAEQDIEEFVRQWALKQLLVKRKLNKWTYIHFYGILFP